VTHYTSACTICGRCWPHLALPVRGDAPHLHREDHARFGERKPRWCRGEVQHVVEQEPVQSRGITVEAGLIERHDGMVRP